MKVTNGDLLIDQPFKLENGIFYYDNKTIRSIDHNPFKRNYKNKVEWWRNSHVILFHGVRSDTLTFKFE